MAELQSSLIKSPYFTTRRETCTISFNVCMSLNKGAEWEKVAISSNGAVGGLPQFFCTPLPLFAPCTIVNHYWWSLLVSLTLSTFNIQSRCTPMSPSRRISTLPCVYVCVAKKVFDQQALLECYKGEAA